MTKLAPQWLEKQSTFMQVGCVVIGHHEQLCEGKEYGVCLGAEDGVAITQPCSESANRWLYNNPHGSATLRLDGGDTCLELESCKNGGDVFAKPCDGGKDQQWAWSGKNGKRQVRPPPPALMTATS